jgi:acetyl esterase/lipase
MDDARVRKDLVYKADSGGQMKADVYTPAGTAKNARLPVIVFIHGGVGDDVPLRPKDWGIYQSCGRLAAASGFTAVTFNHRLGFPDPRLSAAAGDLKAMLDYIRQHAAELNADPNRVCLAAYSAGGPMLSPAVRGELPGVHCLVAFYALLDISDSPFHQQHLSAEEMKLFSPREALIAGSDKMPAMFVARGGRDQIPGFNDWMVRFVDTAIARNAPLTLMIHPTGVHGFDNQNDDDRSREIIKAALEFMKSHLTV